MVDRPWLTRCGASPTTDDLTSRVLGSIVERNPEEAASALGRWQICPVCWRQVVALLPILTPQNGGRS
jgi:hypothetical protein